MASVVPERSVTRATIAAGVNKVVSCSTLPSGPITALTPLVAATSTVRPCSTARTREIACCWYVISVKPKVALFVGTANT